jgi:hypothetical protein
MDKQLDITNIDPIFGYNILNTIKPKFYQTKFPYNLYDEKKLTFTENVIEIIVKNKEKINSSKSKKGGDQYIYIYN